MENNEIKSDLEVVAQKPKRTKLPKRDAKDYEVAFPLIESLKNEGKTISQIQIVLKEKFPEFNPKTLTVKYFKMKKSVKEKSNNEQPTNN